jgi:hypothetical protein
MVLRALPGGQHRGRFGCASIIHIGEANKPALSGKITGNFASKPGCTAGYEYALAVLTHARLSVTNVCVSSGNEARGQPFLADQPTGRYADRDMQRLSALILLLLLLTAPTTVRAEVLATFYSHDFGDHFPHTFVKLKGTVDKTGEAVDTNYGFTAVNTTPAILWGSVNGKIEIKDAKYIEKSNAHFTLKLSDAQYDALLAHVEKWRNKPQKSYNLNKSNCVHFVMEAAELLGLKVNRKSKLFKKPKSFVLEIMALNPGLSL